MFVPVTGTTQEPRDLAPNRPGPPAKPRWGQRIGLVGGNYLPVDLNTQIDGQGFRLADARFVERSDIPGCESYAI